MENNVEQTRTRYGYPFARAYIYGARFIAIVIVICGIFVAINFTMKGLQMAGASYFKDRFLSLVATAQENNAKALKVFTAARITAIDITPDLEALRQDVDSQSVDSFYRPGITRLIATHKKLTAAIIDAINKVSDQTDADEKPRRRHEEFSDNCEALVRDVSTDKKLSSGMYLQGFIFLASALAAAFAICVVADFLQAMIDIAVSTRRTADNTDAISVQS